jgi:hypothetical protein
MRRSSGLLLVAALSALSVAGCGHGAGTASSGRAAYVAYVLAARPGQPADGFTDGAAISGGIEVGAAQGGNGAVFWTGLSGPAIDVNQTGLAELTAKGTSNGTVVGSGTVLGTENGQALLWPAPGAPAIVLNPPGYGSCEANGVAGRQQVGYGWIAGHEHALLWTGSASSAVDLNPPGAPDSFAYSTDGTVQGGEAGGHAAIWAGSASSYIDMNPPGSSGSVIFGVSSRQRVGQASFGGQTHAAVWSDTASSAVDLHPAGYEFSRALATAGQKQVGYGSNLVPGGDGESVAHALVWTGTARSVVDLHQFLPASFQGPASVSEAKGIDADGNIIGSANGRAVVWVPQK